jgi:hypothetical protein
MMGLFRSATQEADRQQPAVSSSAQLKNHILDLPPVTTADVTDLDGKSFNVFDMTMNGIQIATTVRDALVLTQSMRLIDEVTKDAQAVRIGTRSAERFMSPLEALGPLATYTSFWIDLAAAWADAKARILKDNAARGISVGVMLGANDAAPPYVVSHFWQQAKASYPADREVEVAAKNMHNTALVAGYGQGKSLTKTQKGRLFAYLHGQMSEEERSYYFGVNPEDWGPSRRKYYYILCAALFRNYHLE